MNSDDWIVEMNSDLTFVLRMEVSLELHLLLEDGQVLAVNHVCARKTLGSKGDSGRGTGIWRRFSGKMSRERRKRFRRCCSDRKSGKGTKVSAECAVIELTRMTGRSATTEHDLEAGK